MASNALPNDVAEEAKLVETEEEEIAARSAPVRRNRRLILGGVLGTALAAGVAWKALAPCVEVNGISRDSANSVVTLAAQYPEDLNDLLDGRNDEDARGQWLAAARAMGAGAAKADEQTKEITARTHAAVQKAMDVSDPLEADKIVKRAMMRAVENSKLKRRKLKELIHGPKHFLKGNKKAKKDEQKPEKEEPKRTKEVQSTTGKPKAMHAKNPTAKMFGSLTGSKDKHPWKRTTTQDPGDPMGEHHAQCVFDVLSATNTFAGIAANLNDVSKTCKHVDPKDMFGSKHSPETVHAKVCSVNVFAVLGGFVSLATSLSNAADSCAATLVPDIDAKCSAAVTGLVTAVSQTGGAFTLMSAACSEKGWYADVPEGRFPHNVGSNEVYEHDYLNKGGNGAPNTGRLLAEAPGVMSDEAAGPAPPRQLLFGGGKGSTATQCAVEISSVMWSLASAGLAINAAGNVDDPGCPPKNLWGETDPKKKGLVWEISQGMCAINIESAITSFLGVIAILQLVAVNCVDTLNIRAICGAGVSGLFAGSAGIAQAATGLYLVCDKLQDEPLHKLVTAVRGIDAKTGLITNTMTGDSSSVFGRRLAEVENSVADLKQRFATPEEAWMSIGYNLNNASAVFRKAGLPEPNLKAFASLVEEPEAVEDGGAGLFGSQHTCS